MSHCSPAGFCLAKSLLLHVLCIPPTPLPSLPVQQRRSVGFWNGNERLQQEGPGGAVGQSEWWVGSPAAAASWHVLSRHCPGRSQSLASDTGRLSGYNLLPGTSDLCKQTNQGTLPLPQAPRSFLMVLGDKGSTTNQDGRVFEVGQGWRETAVQQIFYMFCMRGNDKCS